MGEIVIKIPAKKNRRYVIDSAADAERLIDALDRSAVRVKDDPASAEDLEFIEDVRDVREAVEEFQRSGKTHRWEDVKADLGL